MLESRQVNGQIPSLIGLLYFLLYQPAAIRVQNLRKLRCFVEPNACDNVLKYPLQIGCAMATMICTQRQSLRGCQNLTLMVLYDNMYLRIQLHHVDVYWCITYIGLHLTYICHGERNLMSMQVSLCMLYANKCQNHAIHSLYLHFIKQYGFQ